MMILKNLHVAVYYNKTAESVFFMNLSVLQHTYSLKFLLSINLYDCVMNQFSNKYE